MILIGQWSCFRMDFQNLSLNANNILSKHANSLWLAQTGTMENWFNLMVMLSIFSDTLHGVEAQLWFRQGLGLVHTGRLCWWDRPEWDVGYSVCKCWKWVYDMCSLYFTVILKSPASSRYFQHILTKNSKTSHIHIETDLLLFTVVNQF